MWRQSVGDWQERRQRRSGPIPATPQARLPDTVSSAEHAARGFLPSGFHDHAQPSAYPAADPRESGGPPPCGAATSEQSPSDRALGETWVTVAGAAPDDILDVRDFLDAHVGRTVSHHLPSLASGQTNIVYVQFASALQAAKAVRNRFYTLRNESGIAAIGIRRTVDALPPATALHSYVDVTVSWCLDQMFLAERERLRRQLLEATAPLPQHLTRSSTSEPAGSSAEREVLSQSLQSSVRTSSPRGPSEGAATAGDGDGEAAAHPLLPRHSHRVRSSPHGSPSPSLPRPQPAVPSASTDIQPPVRDPAAYYRAGGDYRYEDSFFSDGLHSANRDSRQRITVLGLFFHPCSSSSGVLYSLCLYGPLRFALLFLWTLCNAVQHLVASSSSSARAASAASRSAATPPSLPPLARWKQRRTLRVSDVVPASASPVEYVAFLLYKYVPFTPDPEEVDVVLWSWLALRSPYPQRSLQLLKQSLLVRQRGANMSVGQVRPSGGIDGSGGSEVDQLARFGRVDVLGGDPYDAAEVQQQAQRRREPRVLLRWRPAWWFARYSSLSLMALVAVVCSHLWASWE